VFFVVVVVAIEKYISPKIYGGAGHQLWLQSAEEAVHR
jgi:hypothetical protein